MIITLLTVVFSVVVALMALFILIQQGKGDMGLGGMGGGTQMLFGGSGGQDFFERGTWVLGAAFMLLSLSLAVMNMQSVYTTKANTTKSAPLNR